MERLSLLLESRDFVAVEEHAQTVGDPEDLAIRQAFAIAHVLRCAATHDWDEALRMPGWVCEAAKHGDLSTPGLKAAYRSIGRLVHPDKCRLAHAGDAFQALQRSVEELARRAERGASPTRRDEADAWWEEWDEWTISQAPPRAADARAAPAPEVDNFAATLHGMGVRDLTRTVAELQRQLTASLGRRGEGARGGTEGEPPAPHVLKTRLAIAREALSRARERDEPANFTSPAGFFPER